MKMTGKIDALFHQLLLERQSAHARQPHVEHEAAGYVRPRRLHEFLRRGGEDHVEPHRPQQILERVAHRRVVVDDEDGWAILAHEWASSGTGIENRKTAPLGSFELADSRPPCASMIERLIDKPMPMPCALVV